MADLGRRLSYVVNMPGSGFGGAVWGLVTCLAPEPGKGGRAASLVDSAPAGLVQLGTVAAGLSMVPDFSPINISRANGMSVNGIPQAPGILDVFDEMKAFYQGHSASPRPDNLSGTLDINVGMIALPSVPVTLPQVSRCAWITARH